MPRNTVDRVAAAVVRRLQAGGGRARPASALVASLTGPRSHGRNAAAQPIDILATKLASAVTRRLATGPAPSGIPLSASGLTRGIVRNVGRQLGKSPGAEPVALSTIDPAAAAKALTGALDLRRAAPVDPAVIVASTIVRRLNRVRLVGTPAEARAFQGRVASIVTAALRPAPAETPQAPAATVEPPAAQPFAAPTPAPAPAAAKPEAGAAAARK